MLRPHPAARLRPRLQPAASRTSLLGARFFHFALAWQVYTIKQRPTALSIGYPGHQLPNLLLVLVGVVFADRYDPAAQVAADIVRAARSRDRVSSRVAGVLVGLAYRAGVVVLLSARRE